jgi:tRNA(adenine34) deaminase
LSRVGQAIGEACNEVDLRHDATAHAEILAMGRAGAKPKSNELTDAVLYTTLQPCGMCTMASIWAKIGRIVYGAGRDDVHEMYFEDRHLDAVDFIRDAYKDDLSLEGGNARRSMCRRAQTFQKSNSLIAEQFGRLARFKL